MVGNTIGWKCLTVGIILCIVLLNGAPATAALLKDDVEIYITSDSTHYPDNPGAASLGNAVIIYVVNHLNEPLGIYIQWDFSTPFLRYPIESYQWRYVHTCDANSSTSSFSSTGTPFPCHLTITVQANDIKYVSRSGFIFFRWVYFPEVK